MASKFEAGQRVRVTDQHITDTKGKMFGQEYNVVRPFGAEEKCFKTAGVVIIASDGMEAFLFDEELELVQ